jgi:hypothetical protein
VAEDRDTPTEGALCQDGRWPGIARVQYGMLAYPLWLLAVAGSIARGDVANVLIIVALFTSPIVICEWRLRKMGFSVQSDALILVRPLNRTRIPWEDIERFELIRPNGLIDYGDRRLAVKRRGGILPRSTMRIPTLWLSVKDTKRWFPPGGQSRLRWASGELTDIVGFLESQLERHQPQLA